MNASIHINDVVSFDFIIARWLLLVPNKESDVGTPSLTPGTRKTLNKPQGTLQV